MFNFLKSSKGGGGDRKKNRKKKHRSDLKKRVRSRGSTPDKNPKLGEQRRPPPQRIYIEAQKSDTSAPKKNQRLSSSTKGQAPPQEQQFEQRQQSIMPSQTTVASTKAPDNQPNRYTYREYLAGIPSPYRPPPPNLGQQLPAKPTYRQRLQATRPPPLKQPPPAPQNSESKKEVQSKSKLSQSEKKQKSAAETVAFKQKSAETVAFKPNSNNNEKSTEKLAESSVAPKEKGKEQVQRPNTAKSNKEHEVERMKTFIQYFMKREASELDSQFDKLKSYIPKSFTRYLFDDNSDKCRFADIICMDQTRIVLEDCAEGGFIHASWVPMSKDNFNDRFIVSQFPNEESLFDFWHMLWQENVSTIINIMTTEEWKEYGAPLGLLPEIGKCRHVTAGYTVTFQKEVKFNREYKAAVYGITHENEYRQVLWITYLGWPEGKCPKDTEAILQILSLTKTRRRPLLVISLAGAGRAGTYVSLEYIHTLLHSLKPKKISIFDCVQKIRDSRLHSVQTIHQYKFIFLVLIDHVLLVKKIRNEIGTEIVEKYGSLKQKILTKAWEEEKQLSNIIFNTLIILSLILQFLFYTFHTSVLILLIAKRKTIFKGSFYNILRIVLFADLVCFIFSTIGKKLPLFDIFEDFFKNDHVLSSLIVTITSGSTALQFIGHTLISFNRFTIIWFPLHQKTIWNYHWYTVVLIGIPIIHVSVRTHEPGFFLFASDFVVTATIQNVEVLELFLKISTVLYMTTTCIAAFFNSLSFFKFYFYNQNSTTFNVNETNLMFVSFAVFLAQLLRISYDINGIFFSSNPELSIFFRTALPFFNDITALTGSISLLILSKTALDSYKLYYFNKKRSFYRHRNTVSPSVKVVTTVM